MNKLLPFLLFFVFSSSLFAQSKDDIIAKTLVEKNAATIGLSKEDLQNYIVNNSYHIASTNTQMVYLLQSYKGLPIYNQMIVLAFKDEKVISNMGSFLKDVNNKTNGVSASPKLTAQNAIKFAFKEANIEAPNRINIVSKSNNGNKIDFGKFSNTRENVIADLMWVPVIVGKATSLKLAWQIQVAPTENSDYWNIRVNANNGSIVDKNNYTVYEKFETPFNKNKAIPKNNFVVKREGKKFYLPKFNFNFKIQTLVNTANYLVIPYPAESPIHPGGTAATRTNPWTLAGGNAVSLGWHNDGTTDYTTSRGNNVHAHEDVLGNNSNTGIMANSTTAPDPLNFIYTPAYNVAPTTPNFQQFAITNLFYWNNILHDITYKYGFDEVSGNFQNNNQGRGGAQSDYVNADAQDGSGTDNANMSTPVDGSKPRMQMYLWSAPTSMVVNTPAAIAGNYNNVEGVFSTANLITNVGPVTGQVVWYNDDATGTTHDACTAPVNNISGKIALIKRNTCSFVIKVKNAQDAGALAVIMVNNVATAPIPMGGTDNTITIPAVMISDVDGATIAAQLANNVNVTLSAGVKIDGDIDNGIVCHEFFHGVSTRLTGGPANSSCLSNAEEAGEGWSDYNGLMLTTNWATAVATDGFNKPRPIGNYAVSQPVTAGGIRNYPYCTNTVVNPLTYANVGVAPIGTEIHNIGEVWCMALWEMTWNIIQTDGINPNLFNNTATGGNSVAYKLVIEGLRLQPCSPGFIDARNAILQADLNLYGGVHYCAIWSAFAKRGMGYSASQGLSSSATDQTAATDLPPAPTISTQPASVSICTGASTSFSMAATGTNLSYQWQVSTNSGSTWTNITNGGVYSGATTNTLSLASPTSTYSGYQYRCVLSGNCNLPNNINSNVATLTLTTSVPTINTQPTNTSTCVTSTATFSVAAAGGTITYVWQESTNGGSTWNNLTNGGIYSNATTATLTLTGVLSTMNNYQYRCVVTGGCGSTTSVNSNAGVLTVTATVPIVITSQPVSSVVCEGSNTAFNVVATGTGLTYNWQVSTDGGATWANTSPAANTATLNLTAVTASMNNYQYRCVITGTTSCSTGGFNSGNAILTVNTKPLIATQPTAATICVGSNTSFISSATGTGVGYQWQVNTGGCSGTTWTNITNGGVYSGATSGTLNITTATAVMTTYAYRMVATGTCTPAANSNCVALTVVSPAAITANPINVSICENAPTSFTSSGNANATNLQWQVSTNGGSTWTNITNIGVYTGATTGTLSISSAAITMTGYLYRLNVSNATCTAIASSTSASLTILALPNVSATASLSSVCTGTSSVLTATGANTYTWLPTGTGSTGVVTVTPTVTTTYTVTGTNTSNGCTKAANVTVVATAKPTVTLSASQYTSLLPGQTTNLTATATSASASTYTYTWSYAGTGTATAFAGNTHLVNMSGLGTYTVTAADATNAACASLPTSITINETPSDNLFMFGNPNNGLFTVSYYNSGGTATSQTVSLYDDRGRKVYNKSFAVNQTYQLLTVDARFLSSATYILVLRDASGKKLKSGKVQIRH